MASNDREINVDDLVVGGVLSVLQRQSWESWTGTMSELRASIVKPLNKKERSIFPRSPSALRVVLNRVANRIRNRGIGVRFGRTTDHMRTRFVKFTQ